MPFYRLTPAQAERLAAHLSTVLTGDALTQAVVSIDQVCVFCAPSKSADHPRRRAQLRAIQRTAAKLMLLLANEQPRRPMVLDFPVVAVTPPLREWLQIDWSAFDFALLAIDLAAGGRQSGRGRPRHTWRRTLVIALWMLYPTGKVAKTERSHFEHTVAMVLGFFGHRLTPEAVHAIVIDALPKRVRLPPAHRSLAAASARRRRVKIRTEIRRFSALTLSPARRDNGRMSHEDPRHATQRAESEPPDDSLISDRAFRERLGAISKTTEWRRRKVDPHFPQPVQIGGRNFFSDREARQYVVRMLKQRGARKNGD